MLLSGVGLTYIRYYHYEKVKKMTEVSVIFMLLSLKMPTISEITVTWPEDQLNHPETGEDFKKFVENFEWNLVAKGTQERICITNQQIMNQTLVKLEKPIVDPVSDKNPFDYEESRATFNSEGKKFFVNILLNNFTKQSGERLDISLFLGGPLLAIHAGDVTPV